MKRLLCLIGALACGLVLTSAMMLVIPLAIKPAFADPGVLYVAPGGNCGGASPCYSTVQAAVDAAAELDTIKVAAGSYTGVQNIPSLSTSTFTATQVVAITKSVTIQGGYTSADWNTFDPDANITALDAQGQGRVLVVAASGDGGACIIEGLHITGGDATGLGGFWQGDEDNGGGVCVDRATVVMKTNWVYDNTAYRGGGIYLHLGSASTLSKNSILSNTAHAGGGVYLNGGNTPVLLGNTLSSNTIVSNTANTGGGLYLVYSDATLIDNTITGNHSDYVGGGLYVGSSIAKATDNSIADNTAGNGGGGLYLSGSSGAPILIGNTIISNTAEYFGGGLEMQFTAGTFIRNTFVGNEAESQSGGGVYIVASHAAFTNKAVTT